MIIYFAGDGKKQENSRRLASMESENWGVLLAYKSIKSKDNKGNIRYKRLKRRLP